MDDKYIDREAVLSEYRNAYHEFNGRYPAITVSRGWYRIEENMNRHRIKDLADMAERLRQRSQARGDQELADMTDERDLSYFENMSRDEIVALLADVEQNDDMVEFLREHTKGYIDTGKPMVFTLAKDLGLF